MLKDQRTFWGIHKQGDDQNQICTNDSSKTISCIALFSSPPNGVADY